MTDLVRMRGGDRNDRLCQGEEMRQRRLQTMSGCKGEREGVEMTGLARVKG